MKEDAHASIQDQNFGEPIKPPAKSEVKTSEKAKKSTNIKVVAALITIAVLIGLSIALLIMKANGFFATPESNVATRQPKDESSSGSVAFRPSKNKHDEQADGEYEGELVTDQDYIEKLYERMALLHDFYTYVDNDKPKVVARVTIGQYVELYENTMSNQRKTHIVLSFLSDNRSTYAEFRDIFQPINDYQRVYDIVLAAQGGNCVPDISCADKQHSTKADDSAVGAAYSAFFQGNISKDAMIAEGASPCERYFYDDQLKLWYRSDGIGCGGARQDELLLYIEQYTHTSERSYVYIRVGARKEGAIYFDKLTSFDDNVTKHRQLTAEDSADDIINSSNYKDFAQYRFVFQNTQAGPVFEKVEKLSK